MRRNTLPLAIGAIAVLLVLLLAMCPTPPPPRIAPPPVPVSNVVSFDQPVHYCVPRPATAPEGRVQILVDSSGSMAGVRSSTLRYVHWVESSISRMRGALAVRAIRIAQFDRRRGIEPASDLASFESNYAPRGHTTLHSAISSSVGYDVTYILTDGVDAVGSGDGLCASGVDAACVAQSLREAVRAGTRASPAGIWIIPLSSVHEGPYYTEKPSPTNAFDPQELRAELSDELKTDIIVANPRLDGSENLMFHYKGPRTLLLIVIARSSDLGRIGLASLREVAAQSDISTANGGSSEAKTLRSSTPIEIYPGFVSPSRWSRLVQSDATRPIGTIDVSLVSGTRLTVDCPTTRNGEADYFLSFEPVQESTRCFDLYQLPQFELALEPARAADARDFASMIPQVSRAPSQETEQLILRIACTGGGSRPCISNPIHATYAATARYDLGINSGSGVSGAGKLIDSISTDDPVRQPHRVYGLKRLFSFFFDDLGREHTKSVLAQIEICNRSATTAVSAASGEMADRN